MSAQLHGIEVKLKEKFRMNQTIALLFGTLRAVGRKKNKKMYSNVNQIANWQLTLTRQSTGKQN